MSKSMSMSKTLSPQALAASLSELWSPRVIGEVDDMYVKVAKVQGEMPWHQHDSEDEFFYVLKGEFCLEFEQGPVVLREGEMYIVPKGTRHHPIARSECLLLLFERKSTQHTGDIMTSQTRTIAEQLRPLPSGRDS